jgi:2-polyprenyl-3-methyl-5-hydroxy-6-metoxy-1,4-benzoquinol methylase
MADDRWWKDFDAVVASTLPRGSRILDIGGGDRGLVDRLAELGLDPIGVDPRAPAHPLLIQARVEHATEFGEFDAITAVMALHHADLPAVLQAIQGHLRPNGRLLVYEFDWMASDECAAAWLAEHDRSDTDNSVAGCSASTETSTAGPRSERRWPAASRPSRPAVPTSLAC